MRSLNTLIRGKQSNVGLAARTVPLHFGKGAPVVGFHANNGTVESAAAGTITGKIQLKTMRGRPAQRADARQGDKNSTGWFAATPSSCLVSVQYAGTRARHSSRTTRRDCQRCLFGFQSKTTKSFAETTAEHVRRRHHSLLLYNRTAQSPGRSSGQSSYPYYSRRR